MRALVLVLLLAGCARPNFEGIPPVYGCEDLEEFGCPDSKPE